MMKIAKDKRYALLPFCQTSMIQMQMKEINTLRNYKKSQRKIETIHLCSFGYKQEINLILKDN